MAQHITRGGTYYRVCDPSWSDPRDTSFSKRRGGRWNPAGAFGALYLNASIAVAALNAHRALAREFGTAIGLADVRPEQRPDLQTFTITHHAFVDAVTGGGLLDLGLPATYPDAVTHGETHAVARTLYAADEAGIAARSAVVATEEELAIFDSHIALARRKASGRVPFGAWYPGLVP